MLHALGLLALLAVLALMLHALGLLALLHAVLALVLHASSLLALLTFSLLALLLSSLGLAVGALLIGRLVTLLSILVILAAFLLYLRSSVYCLSVHSTNGKSHHHERKQ